MADRFDLETEIMKCGATEDELDTLITHILEYDLSADDTVNALLGIAALHKMRLANLFTTFKAVFKLDEYKHDYAETLAQTEQNPDDKHYKNNKKNKYKDA
jgi:hypothetical protein